MAEIQEVVTDVTSVTISFTVEELQAMHNVFHHVQLGTKGFPAASLSILRMLNDLFGGVENTDHYVDMYGNGSIGLYWKLQPDD